MSLLNVDIDNTAKIENNMVNENDVEDTGMIIPPIPSGDDFESDPKVRYFPLKSSQYVVVGAILHHDCILTS